MDSYRLERPGRPDLVFNGELLAESSSRNIGNLPADRWMELYLWRTDTGRWVVRIIGKSVLPDEEDRDRIVICNSPRMVRATLERTNRKADDPLYGKRYLTIMAMDLLDAAAEKDPELAGLTEERI